MASPRKEEKHKAKNPDSKLAPTLQPVPTHFSDKDRVRENTAWQTLLSGIASLAKKRKLNKEIFISYAWPTEKDELDKMQRWLKHLQDDLEAADIRVFFDSRDMELNLERTMQLYLEKSDFILPILTPRFLERAQDEKTNLAFEFRLSMKKEESHPGSLIPILYSGSFGKVINGEYDLILMSTAIKDEKEIEKLASAASAANNNLPVLIKKEKKLYLYGNSTGNQWKLTELNSKLMSLITFPEELNHSIMGTKINPVVYTEITLQKGHTVKNPLAPLSKQLIYTVQEHQRKQLITALDNPKGLIPVIYGWRIGDKDYQCLLNTWQEKCLTRLPLSLSNAIERKVEIDKIKEGFADQIRQKVSPIQIIQGMGGIGKSQLIASYASHMAEQIEEKGGFVRWLYADTPTLTTEWTTLPFLNYSSLLQYWYVLL